MAGSGLTCLPRFSAFPSPPAAAAARASRSVWRLQCGGRGRAAPALRPRCRSRTKAAAEERGEASGLPAGLCRPLHRSREEKTGAETPLPSGRGLRRRRAVLARAGFPRLSSGAQTALAQPHGLRMHRINPS